MANKTDYITLSGVQGFWKPYVDGAFGAEEEFGLIDEFSLNISEDELQHISRQCGSVGVADKVVVTKTEIVADITSPEISPTMIARAFKGKLVSNTVEAGTDVAVTVTIDSIDTDEPLPVRHITAIKVKDDTDSVTYEEGTDYSVDYDKGTIRALSGGAISNSDVLHITYSNKRYDAWSIAAFSEKAATGKLRLVACAVEGMDIEYTFEKVTLKLNGSYNVVSAEDFATISLQATVLSDDTITDPSMSKLINIKGDDLFSA